MLRFSHSRGGLWIEATGPREILALMVMTVPLLLGQSCPADTFVLAPTPGGGQTNTIYPLMIQQAGLSSMRYQQVYNQSLFTNGLPYQIGPDQIYITTIQLSVGSPVCSYSPWAVSNVQINLSTTSKNADGLSAVFTENVGDDDTIVYGPASLSGEGIGRILVQFSRPFRYDPKSGSLLIDVRVFDASGPPPPQLCPYPPVIAAENLPSDETSRVWSTNVEASVADHIDTVGFDSTLQFSPVPSLQASASNFNGTNLIIIRWPDQPSVFVLQRSDGLSKSANWTNEPTGGSRIYYFPADSAGPGGFFRLFWSGQ